MNDVIKRWTRVVGWGVLLVCAGCGTDADDADGGTSVADATSDAQGDGGTEEDVTTDAGGGDTVEQDAGGEDAGEDVGEDAGEDVGEDAGEDVGEDAGGDVGEDAGEDAREDGGDDLGSDTSDAGGDAADGGGDATDATDAAGDAADSATDQSDTADSGDACPAACPTPAPIAVDSQNVVIVALDHVANEVTIRNLGDAAVPLNNWQWCRKSGSYGTVGTLSLGVGDDHTFTVSLEPSDAIGLYRNGAFGSSSDLEAYANWLTAGTAAQTGRLSDATGAGVWDEGASNTIELCAGASGFVAVGDVSSAANFTAVATPGSCID